MTKPLDVLDDLLSDPDTETIVANGVGNVIITKVGGVRVKDLRPAESDGELEDLVRRLAGTERGR